MSLCTFFFFFCLQLWCFPGTSGFRRGLSWGRSRTPVCSRAPSLQIHPLATIGGNLHCGVSWHMMLMEKRAPGFNWECQEPCPPSQRTTSPAVQPVRSQAQRWGFPPESWVWDSRMALPVHTHTHTRVSNLGPFSCMSHGFDGVDLLWWSSCFSQEVALA